MPPDETEPTGDYPGESASDDPGESASDGADEGGSKDANASDPVDGGADEGGPIPDYGAKYQPEDPESRYPDPAEELPNVPEPPRPDPDEIPPGLRASFWWLVLVFNAALLALWLGLLFVVFEADYDFGGRLLFAGVVLFAYGYYKYRTNPYR